MMALTSPNSVSPNAVSPNAVSPNSAMGYSYAKRVTREGTQQSNHRVALRLATIPETNRVAANPSGEITSARDSNQTNEDFQLVPELAALIPGGCLRPGSTVGITGDTGCTSLLFQLLAGPMAQGRWAGVVGIPELGAQSGVEHGVLLNHLALIPDPGDRWLDVTAALLDSVELVVLRPQLSHGRCRSSDARRLLARARQRRSVLILVDPAGWPEQPDLLFTAQAARWYGVADGYGALRSQSITVQASGRRLGGRPRQTDLLIGASPSPSVRIQRAG